MNNQPQIQAQPQAQPQVQGQVQPQVQQQVQPQASKRRRVHAFLLSDRIDTANLEHDGFVTLFRYGVAVTLCLSPEEEQHVLRTLEPRLVRPITPPEEETLLIEQAPDKEDQILPGGPMLLKTITPEHLVVIADALSKSVVLARDEREVAGVFDVVEPFARQLADNGRLYAGRRTILKHIGNALLVQHRLSGRVAVTEKPDVVWDRQDLDRLYARLEDEYELKERAEALSRKLAVIADTAEIMTDTIDTRRSLRLEVIIVILIAVELLVAGYQVLHSAN